MKMIKMIGLAGLLFLMNTACEKSVESFAEETIVARIGDRVITEDEFMQRAEYTIRPPWVKQNTYIHKKMILNALIAETLIAMDLPDTSELVQNERFQAFVQGRKEQVMRQVFFKKNMYDKVKLDRKEQEAIYDKAGRTYDVDFIVSRDPRLSGAIEENLAGGAGLADALRNLAGTDSIPVPRRQVMFSPEEDFRIIEKLYNQPVQKGDIVGPIQLDTEKVWLQVQGWTEKVAVSSEDIQNRWRDVQQHVTYRDAAEIYDDYVVDLMQGKKVEFNRDTFFELANTLGPVYFPKNKETKAEITQNIWGKNGEDMAIRDSVSTKLGMMADLPLLTIDGNVWTIEDLDRELMLHPLQFRKKGFSQIEFGEQLKLAIVDIIKDKHITQACYKDGLEEHPLVKARAAMWRDAYLANYARNQKLAELDALEAFKEQPMRTIETHLNPWVDSLQSKYDHLVEINTDLFEDINVTRIDMFAIYADQPYPVIVPPFPQLTTDSRPAAPQAR